MSERESKAAAVSLSVYRKYRPVFSSSWSSSSPFRLSLRVRSERKSEVVSKREHLLSEQIARLQNPDAVFMATQDKWGRSVGGGTETACTGESERGRCCVLRTAEMMMMSPRPLPDF